MQLHSPDYHTSEQAAQSLSIFGRLKKCQRRFCGRMLENNSFCNWEDLFKIKKQAGRRINTRKINEEEGICWLSNKCWLRNRKMVLWKLNRTGQAFSGPVILVARGEICFCCLCVLWIIQWIQNWRKKWCKWVCGDSLLSWTLMFIKASAGYSGTRALELFWWRSGTIVGGGIFAWTLFVEEGWWHFWWGWVTTGVALLEGVAHLQCAFFSGRAAEVGAPLWVSQQW